jgi:hypothetical protein
VIGATPATLLRTAAGAWVDGAYVPGAVTSSTIYASVQPLTDRELATLPEGERTSDTKKAYTTADVRTGSQHDNALADQITWRGVTYEVRKVEEETAVIPHKKLLLVRLREAE